MDKAARYLQLFGNATRLRMLSALLDGSKSVTELADLVDSSLSGVSQHLTKLSSAGIVEGNRDRQHIYYKLLAPKEIRKVLAIVEGM